MKIEDNEYVIYWKNDWLESSDDLSWMFTCIDTGGVFPIKVNTQYLEVFMEFIK